MEGTATGMTHAKDPAIHSLGSHKRTIQRIEEPSLEAGYFVRVGSKAALIFHRKAQLTRNIFLTIGKGQLYRSSMPRRGCMRSRICVPTLVRLRTADWSTDWSKSANVESQGKWEAARAIKFSARIAKFDDMREAYTVETFYAFYF
jgi:hypothetical protein